MLITVNSILKHIYQAHGDYREVKKPGTTKCKTIPGANDNSDNSVTALAFGSTI